jgi:hypothetical protein
LARRRRIDDHTWGLEAGLNQLVNDLDQPCSEANAARAIRSESRKERHRAALRRAYLLPPESIHDGHEVSLQLRVAEATVTKPDWALLCALGAGHSYDELTEHFGASPGSLRIRAMRLRRTIRTVAGSD